MHTVTFTLQLTNVSMLTEVTQATRCSSAPSRDPSFGLNVGEKQPISIPRNPFSQSVCQSGFDGFPVGFGEVCFQLEQSRNVGFSVDGRQKERVSVMEMFLTFCLFGGLEMYNETINIPLPKISTLKFTSSLLF